MHSEKILWWCLVIGIAIIFFNVFLSIVYDIYALACI